MKAGYFKSELINNIEQSTCSDNWETLLNKKNMSALFAYISQGTGYYQQIFPDDMAVAAINITPAFDDGGRFFPNVSAQVQKFDSTDRELIMTALTEKLDLFNKLRGSLAPKSSIPQVNR
jgi:hypothetical protein